MPACWNKAAWQKLVDRGEASGDPPGGYIASAGVQSTQFEDCTLVRKESIDQFPPGWERVGGKAATFGKEKGGRRAEVYSTGGGRWNARFFNRRGRLYVDKGNPPAGVNLISILTAAEDWLNMGAGFLRRSAQSPELATGGNNMKTRSQLGDLVNRTLNAIPSTPPKQVSRPRPVPISKPVSRPTVPSKRAINIPALVNRALEPLHQDIAALASRRQYRREAPPGQNRVDVINRSIIENGQITPSGKMSPRAIVRAGMGLPYAPETKPRGADYRELVRRSVAPRPQMPLPFSRTSVEAVMRSEPSSGLVVHRSRFLPELKFRSAESRDQYDSQLAESQTGGRVPVPGAS